MKKQKAKHEYVIGFVGDRHCVYGKEYFIEGGSGTGICHKMTRWQAETYICRLIHAPKAIYKLVPVKRMK